MRARLALLLVCLAATASADTFKRFLKNGARANNVLLSFLPAGSFGAADECTGNALTGTKLEALTFTRGSSAVCTKTDGTLVTLTSDKPRLQGGGLLVEQASTNLAIRSEAFDNVAWTKTNVTAPSADSNVAPDGTTTAELLAGTSNGGLVESTAAAITGTSGAASVYVKTTSGTQAMAIVLRDTTANADKCTGTLTATTTWQRVTCSSAVITTTNNHTVRIYPGGTAGTGTVVAWGAQQEALPFPSSYVATAGTSVARSADAASLAVPVGGTNVVGCVGATINGRMAVAFNRVFDMDSSNPGYFSGGSTVSMDDGVNTASATITSADARSVRFSAAWGSVQSLTVDGVNSTATYDGSMWSTATLWVGSNSGSANFFNGTLTAVTFGKSMGACL